MKKAKIRISPETGKEQVWVQPEGLTGIWMHHPTEFCERCKPFNKCLGFDSLSDVEWEEVTAIINETGKVPVLKSSCLVEQ